MKTPVDWECYWLSQACLVLGPIGLIYLVLAKGRLNQARVHCRLLHESRQRADTAFETSDMLLQGMQAIVWSIETASVCAENSERVRKILEQSLTQSGALMAESRDRISSLRCTSQDEHLPDAIARAGRELRQGWQPKYRIVVHGNMRDLRPMVRDDVYSIGREALSNAFRHAAATEIEAEFTYQRSELRVYVRDNGCGVRAAAVSGSLAELPRGIREMHRRASSAGATFEIRSRRNAGTEIELRIPAAQAYEIND